MSKIDIETNKYPNCIVWCPIPLITWIFPFIGHIGIANSKGIIYDFQGSYSIGEDHFAFGNPTRYLQLDPSKAYDKPYDDGIIAGSEIFRHKEHLMMYIFY